MAGTAFGDGGGNRPLSGGVGLRALPLLFMGMGGCVAVGGGPIPAPPAPVTDGWTEEGVASWYGEPFHGRITASGEVYDMHGPTAAHRTLPFGTKLRVENLDNGRSTTLRITDRGPFVGNRILDVSRRGAEELQMIGPGTARIRITVIEAPAPVACWEVQAGTFSDRSNAEGLRERLVQERFSVRIDEGADGLHRVRVGSFHDRRAAERAAGRLNGVLLGCGASV